MIDYKIFLVDDDLFCLNMYEQHLRNLGFHDVLMFQSGTDCLNSLIEYPDIIFLDYKMDTLNGFEVLKKIKRFNPNINVVMVSAQEDLQTAVDALKYGAFDYIIKSDQEVEKMAQVINRISSLDKIVKKQKPSRFKSMFSFN
ncbi:MAG: DNA-binding NtrC family response regulator [Saprospiraceae bacterium]|jgi:DNA-binding NtrC family response regulator|tara:strand:- start:559 stop:984 length:426 start_codon:yes stop_codon:yes gene_type:complete